jgi:hypothetical protein
MYMKKILSSIIVVFLFLNAEAQGISVTKVGERNFKKIVILLEQTGHTVVCNDIPPFKELTFVDAHKNVHDLRTGGLLNNKIVVDSYFKGKRTTKYYFGWEITEKDIRVFIYEPKNTKKYKKLVRLAYQELLAKANPKSTDENLIAKKK